MLKISTVILFAILMVVQAHSIASEVLPYHLDDSHQAQTQHSIDEYSAAVNDGQGSGDLPSMPDHYCHANHCHGSHLLLAMHVFDLPLLISEQVVPSYTTQNISAHVETILRPPIV